MVMQLVQREAAIVAEYTNTVTGSWIWEDRQKIRWRRCVKKWAGSGYHVRYFNDRQHLWMDIMEQQHERLTSIVTAALCLYEFYARWPSQEKRTSLGTLQVNAAIRLVSAINFARNLVYFLVAEANSDRRRSGQSWRLLPFMRSWQCTSGAFSVCVCSVCVCTLCVCVHCVCVCVCAVILLMTLKVIDTFNFSLQLLCVLTSGWSGSPTVTLHPVSAYLLHHSPWWQERCCLIKMLYWTLSWVT